jgi:transposase
MRQRHFAGEKLFVDYAGRTVPIYGRSGGESFRAQLFVSAMGASGCAYAEATRTQSLPDWLASHVRALEYYGASPTIFVPDNAKVGVTRADRYEPELQRSYEELAAHYQVVIIPADRIGPKIKAASSLRCFWCVAGSSRGCAINVSSVWRS